MLVLAIVFLIFANVVNHSKGISTNVKTACLFLAYLWLILIFSFRGPEVPDTLAYMKIYYGNFAASYFEYLYSILCRLARSVGLGFNGFLFLYQIILFILWFTATRKILTDIHLAFMVFLPFMGVYNFGIIIRAGMGLSVCYIALTYLIQNRSLKGYIIYYTIVTAAVFFHQSMIVFYILPLYVFKDIKTLFLFIIIIISVLIPLFNIQHIIANFLEAYIKFFSFNKFLSYTQIHANFSLHAIYSLTMIKYTIMAIIFLWLRPKITSKKELYNFFLNIYITGVLMISMTFFIAAGNRLAYMFFFFEFALVGLVYEYSELPKKLVFLSAILLALLNYANLVSAIPVMLTY
ncbi:MAG: EpsG family protein [Bacteroidales bacterium]|nr:EpsG family protein [Bacteroidales bacterium]